MSESIPQRKAVEELQQFGLREYEAKCFVSLTKITAGTAREVSEHIDIPRTRVYEAVRSLESDGLVEIQHSSPQQFRAIPITEAIQILTDRYQSRIDSVEKSLRELKRATTETDSDHHPEVWSIVGSDTINTRSKRLIEDASREVLLLVGDGRALSTELLQTVSGVVDRNIDIVVGAGSGSIRDELSAVLPAQIIFESELPWLSPETDGGRFRLGRLLLVDNERLLVSTIHQSDGTPQEQAVCGSGASNGLVLVMHQLLRKQMNVSPELQ